MQSTSSQKCQLPGVSSSIRVSCCGQDASHRKFCCPVASSVLVHTSSPRCVKALRANNMRQGLGCPATPHANMHGAAARSWHDLGFAEQPLYRGTSTCCNCLCIPIPFAIYGKGTMLTPLSGCATCVASEELALADAAGSCLARGRHASKLGCGAARSCVKKSEPLDLRPAPQERPKMPKT